ncbi:MAG: glycosyltransferase [Pseudomonadota bacterium]
MKILAAPAFKNVRGNPYNSLLYTHLQKVPGVSANDFSWRALLTDKPSILHLHWPEHVFGNHFGVNFLVRFISLTLKILVAKAMGIRVVWTVHNLESHEHLHPRLELWCKRHFIAVVDGVIYLTDTGRELAVTKYPVLALKKSAVICHGHYQNAYPNVVGKTAARAKLGLAEDDHVILFLGKVRRYKNVENLMKIFSGMSQGNLRLVVAGSVSNNIALEQNIRGLASLDSRISLHLEHIESEDITAFLNAADLMVLPYLDILNSGAAILGLSFGVPVLVPDIGAMADLQSQFGSHRVHLYQKDLSAHVLEAVLDSIAQRSEVEEVGERDFPIEFDWVHIARQTFSFYTEVVSD